MLWHLPKQRTNVLTLAVVTALMSFSTSSQAVSYGSTTINSTQHQPLNAVIPVKDIDADNFDVSIANNALYQQMNFSKNSSITARFSKTSATTGNIILTSSQPISDPFADVVLNVDENGNKQILPKTLLMPLGDSVPNMATNKPVVVEAVQPSLPTVTPVTESPAIDSAPISLSNSMSNIVFSDVNNLEDNTVVANNETVPVEESSSVSDLPPLESMSGSTVSSSLTFNTTTEEPPIGQLATDKYILNGAQPSADTMLNTKNNVETTEQSSTSNEQATAQTNEAAASTSNAGQSTTQKASGTAKYVVQRHDTLWTIAVEIARRNKMNPNQVMEQIHHNNKAAFINGNANRIKANATIVLPDYEVVPSQQTLQETLAARRAAHSRSNSRTNTQASSQRNTNTVRSSQNSQASSGSRSQVSLVTQAKSNQSAASSSSSSANGNGATNNTLVARLRNTRNSTAQTASRVRELSSQASGYRSSINVQNNKIAELEARLQQLRDQQTASN